MADNARVKVLEVDQWTSTGNVAGTKMEDWEADTNKMLRSVRGGDSEAARAIFGGHAAIREVLAKSEPLMGNVWFKPDENGVLRLWKHNYDSGD